MTPTPADSLLLDLLQLPLCLTAAAFAQLSKLKIYRTMAGKNKAILASETIKSREECETIDANVFGDGA